MNEMEIEIDNMQTAFTPGETIRCSVRWNLPDPPKKASLRLLWYTTGKGTEDVGVADETDCPNPGPTGGGTFEFTAPSAPYSFSGKLISLVWTLELAADKKCVRQDITISPTGREILLYQQAAL